MYNNDIEEIFQRLSLNYYKLYPDMPEVPVNVIFTDCLSKTHLELRPDLEERLIADQIEKDDCYNGRMVLPFSINDNIYILLNNKKIIEYTDDKSYTWIGTFAHELTHVIDFHMMALKEGLDSYDPLNETCQYFMFQLWSEYHARKLGYGFLRNQLDVDSNVDNEFERIKYILEVEWPKHKNDHFKQYHEVKDCYKEIYITMQLLGRYSVWCELFSNEFNQSALKKEFINTPWLYHIYAFLSQHSTLDSIYPHLEDMRLVLKENWKGL